MPSRIHTFHLVVRLAILLASVRSSGLMAHAANSPDFLWANQGATTDSADAYRVAVDSSGNVFVAGSFVNRLRLGGTTLTSHGLVQDDIFIAKYDGTGNLLWARSAGGSGTDYALGMAVDTNGNCYVTGSFQYVADFGSVSITNTTGGGGLFLAKYDPQGGLMWVKKATGESVRGEGLAVDPHGNLFIVGTFAQSAYFDNLSISTPPRVNIFVAKYNSNGIPAWVRQASTDSTGYGTDVAADQSGNCYITGFYNTAATFGGITLTASPDADGIFLVRYDSEGNVVWARQGAGPRAPGGTVSDAGNGVGIDRLGNVYLSGFFEYPITFDRFSLTNGYGHIFLAKYDSLGNILWIREGGGGNERSYHSAVDASGDIYLTGYLRSGIAVFDGNSFTNQGDYNAFVAKYDSAGNFRGLSQARGAGNSYSQGFATAIDSLGNNYLTGIVGMTPSLFGTNSLSSGSGIRTVYVAKLEPFPPTLSINRRAAGIVLCWPLWATNYQLESAATIPGSGTWSPVTNGPSSVTGENVVTNVNTNQKSFFRLKKQ